MTHPRTTCFRDLFSPGFRTTIPQTPINREEEKAESGLPSQAPDITFTHTPPSQTQLRTPLPYK